jgi:lantibiotic modifying enzyme
VEVPGQRGVAPNGITDIADGLGGALLGLTALLEHRTEASLVRAVEEWREQLLASAIGPSEAVSSAGFAHGPGGVACALSRVFEFLGDARCLRRAEVLLRSAVAVAARGTGVGGLDLAWCRGVSGLGMALVAVDDVLGSEVSRRIIDDISNHVIRSNPAVKGDVCCGNFGRVELLIEAALVLERPAFSGSAVELVETLATPAIAQVTGDDYDPGFFCGLAGIGYTLLRLARPGAYPSVAGFRPVP